MPPTTPPTIAPVLDEEWVAPVLVTSVIWVPGANTVVLAITVVKT